MNVGLPFSMFSGKCYFLLLVTLAEGLLCFDLLKPVKPFKPVGFRVRTGYVVLTTATIAKPESGLLLRNLSWVTIIRVYSK